MKADYQNSLPLFEKYIRYINPPWLLSVGVTNIAKLNSLGVLKEIRQHFDDQKKFSGFSGQLWDWHLFAVPHPGARLTNNSRFRIWERVTEEMKRVTKFD